MKKQGKEWSAKCPMLGAVAVMMGVMAAFAEPSVEITKGKLADAHDGTVEYAYTVRGDFKGRKYDLLVKISSDDGTKSVVLTNENVSAGSVTRTVNVKTLLGKAYPGVTIFASLEDKGKAGVQLWAGGPYFAECNLGATRPEDYGWYFWWGDTVGYELNEAKDGWVSVVDGTPIVFGVSDATATSTYNKSNTTLRSEGWIDGSGNLVAAHDAATAKLGAPWRMMTVAELKNLVDVSVCKRVWVANYKSTGVTGSGISPVSNPLKRPHP